MNETPNEHSEYQPDFVFGGGRIISEANWAECEAQGVRNVVEAIPEDDEDALRKELAQKGREFGPETLLLGDAFDAESGMPLHHKPGIGLYTVGEGAGRSRRSHTPVLSIGGRRFVLRPGETAKFPKRDTPPSADDVSNKS